MIGQADLYKITILTQRVNVHISPKLPVPTNTKIPGFDLAVSKAKKPPTY